VDAVRGHEAVETFACFGGEATVVVAGAGPGGSAAAAARLARSRLLGWHAQFSRFEADSELSRLNGDPRETVPVSVVMGRLIHATLDGAALSGGLVDGSLVEDLERAGYRGSFESVSVPLAESLALAPPRAPAAPDPTARWAEVSLDLAGGTVTRPPGLSFDFGGLAKGLFGDILASVLAGHDEFAIVAGGDVRFGGTAARRRRVQVADPFTDSILHTFELRDGAIATSGIGRRSWLDAEGRPSHHLLDPASGRAAFTGIVQATAIAPRALEAEVLAKTALLRGPKGAVATLRHGGLVVHDDGHFELLAPVATI
jgi:thiamine biosynthesis lipoprotein